MAEIALVTAIAGAAVSAGGAIAQGNAEADARTDEARNREIEAKSTERVAGEQRSASQREAIRRSQEASLVLSRQQAVAAASGGGAADKSVLDLMGDTAAEGAYQTDAALYEGESRARGQDDQAEILRRQAAMERNRGRAARTAGYVNAAATTLNAVSSFGKPSKAGLGGKV